MIDLKDLVIDYKSIIPVYEQIKQFYKLSILNGALTSDEKIISVREMARITKVNQNTIVKSYYQLEQEGFIYSKPGRGYFVKEVIDNDQKERGDLFGNITREYLEKVMALGYSIEEVITELKKLK